MSTTTTSRRRFILKVLGLAVPFASLGSLTLAQEPQRVVMIYRDVPGPDQPDDRSDPERLFKMHHIFPQEAAELVHINDRRDVRTLDPKGTGTCCELAFQLDGAGWFAGVKAIPGGVDPGERPGIDVNRLLRLGEDLQTKVVLRFRARSEAKTRPKASFRVGGTAGPKYRDGLEFPIGLGPPPRKRPVLTELTDQWTQYEIDLSGKPRELQSVICPFWVLVKADDNPGLEVVRFFLDDIHFAVVPPK